jgi:Ca2+-binding RTX toxin-like protein
MVAEAAPAQRPRAEANQPSCREGAAGHGGSVVMARIIGDNRDNTLVGTRDADFISGRGGDDHLFGRGGDDTLDGGPGDDTFDGGPGRDTLTFAKLQGDEGVFISAFLSGDFVGRQITFPEDFSLLTSIEAIVGSENDDTIPGDVGRDELRGGGGQDRLDGLGGSDRIRGGPGADIIFGEDPNDATGLFGPEGNDRLLGEDGNDQLFGSGGRDEIRGGSGFDILDGNAGDDVLIGGVGPDIFRYRLIDRLDEFEPVAGDGEDLVRDFTRGTDLLSLELFATDGFDADRERGAALFDAVDTNGNSVLDNADEHVTVANATYQGETRRSTIIELGERHDELFGTSGEFGADDRLVVFGVTGLTVDDVAPFSVEPFFLG